MRFIVPLGLAAMTAACSSAAPTEPSGNAATARYRVAFQATWSIGSHATDFPTTAHFSALVGGTHNSQVTFWREGTIATDGIRDMAERGITTTVASEIDAAAAGGAAQRAFTGGGVGSSPGSAVAEFDIRQSHPLVTLVSMIAPSPDWFVGVSSLPLFEGGQWATSRRVDLDPWDAGTDGGATFTSPDLTLAPRLPIARIVTSPLSPNGRVTPLGTFTFTRLE